MRICSGVHGEREWGHANGSTRTGSPDREPVQKRQCRRRIKKVVQGIPGPPLMMTWSGSCLESTLKSPPKTTELSLKDFRVPKWFRYTMSPVWADDRSGISAVPNGGAILRVVR